jgi:hypothetical protein
VVGQVHFEDYPEIFEKYDVNVFPTFLVIKNGEVKRRIKGLVPKYYLNDLLGALQ